MDFAAGTNNNFNGAGRNTHTKKINAKAGSNTNFSLMNMAYTPQPQLVNLKVLDLQSLQFVDAPFKYTPEDPNKQYIMDPNSNQNFVKLPGFCDGAGCQLMNLNQNAFFLN